MATKFENANVPATRLTAMNVPFFRPAITDAEIEEVAGCLRSGWLTSGPMARRFETEFAQAVGANTR